MSRASHAEPGHVAKEGQSCKLNVMMKKLIETPLTDAFMRVRKGRGENT